MTSLRAFYAGVPYLPESATTQRPDQVGVGDVTYLKVAGKWRHMAAVMDKHSRRIVGWSMGARRDAALTREALAPVGPEPLRQSQRDLPQRPRDRVRQLRIPKAAK